LIKLKRFIPPAVCFVLVNSVLIPWEMHILGVFVHPSDLAIVLGTLCLTLYFRDIAVISFVKGFIFKFADVWLLMLFTSLSVLTSVNKHASLVEIIQLFEVFVCCLLFLEVFLQQIDPLEKYMKYCLGSFVVVFITIYVIYFSHCYTETIYPVLRFGGTPARWYYYFHEQAKATLLGAFVLYALLYTFKFDSHWWEKGINILLGLSAF